MGTLSLSCNIQGLQFSGQRIQSKDALTRQRHHSNQAKFSSSYSSFQLHEQQSHLDDSPLQQQKPRLGNNGRRDPLTSLNMKLDVLARAEAPEHAQMLYQRIAALYEEGYYPARPDLVSFNTVLKAYKEDPEGALAFWEQEAHQIVPSVRSYNAFLLSLAKAGLCEQAEALLRHMQAINSNAQPNLISYNTVLLAFRNSIESDAAEKAESILMEMIQSEQYDEISFNTVIAAWSSRNNRTATQKAHDCLNMMRMYSIEPDVYSYTTLIQAYARCKGESSRCLQLLRNMQQEHKQPNQITYTAVIQALCRDQEPQQAMALLEETWAHHDPNVLPDVVTYSALIDEWAFVADVQPLEALDATMQLLEQMQRQNIMPNEQTYTSVLSAIARSSQYDSGERAWSMMQRMRRNNIPVSIIHYNAVLDAYSRSPNAEKVVEARRVWQELIDYDLEPDFITYNSLMSVGSNAFGKADVRQLGLQLALDAFRAIQSDATCQATSLTFNYLFKSVRKFMAPSEQRTKAIQHAFKLCCQQGCLNEHIFRYLQQQTCSNDEFKMLLGECWKTDAQLEDMPSEWLRNALPMRSKVYSS
ncbi:hypothetical protein MPSEU_000690100 [Mayamaea pseudoterrestris]|nr:hypothetical protein MPSEU_000690100 [Mayamaea pseudoterrestris]